MIYNHHDWPFGEGMLGMPIPCILLILSKTLCLFVSVAKKEILIHRDFSIQGHSKLFKGVQSHSKVFTCIIFYFYAPPPKTSRCLDRLPGVFAPLRETPKTGQIKAIKPKSSRYKPKNLFFET